MTRPNYIHLLIGLLFCFCIFSKQAAQGYDFVIEPAGVQDVVAESTDVDDFIEQADDLILLSFFLLAAFLTLVAPIFSYSGYAQPDIPTPKRPPTI